MTFKQILQNQLKLRGYLSVNDVMALCQEYGHLYDTGRNYLEPKRTPFAKKDYNEKTGNIKGWKYIKEPVIFNKPLNNPTTKLETPKQASMFKTRSYDY